VIAFTPHGPVDTVVPIPVHTYTFGGSKGGTLYLATSRTSITDAQLRESRLAVSLFACTEVASRLPAFALGG
jgi:sugar lactone lactonase YvrE